MQTDKIKKFDRREKKNEELGVSTRRHIICISNRKNCFCINKPLNYNE